MSDNDEIKPGDRFERVGPGAWGVNHGDVCTALRPAGNGYNGWFVRGSNTIMYLGNPALWQRLPRTDAPAVKVGDIVRDPALLAAGMQVQIVGDGRYPWVYQDWLAGDPVTSGVIRRDGVRVLALPEPPKAEAVRVDDIVAPPPRCKPGCTPREPCWVKNVCPGYREGVPGVSRYGCKGISADLPPARASATYQPRCAEFAGWSNWNGRAGK